MSKYVKKRRAAGARLAGDDWLDTAQKAFQTGADIAQTGENIYERFTPPDNATDSAAPATIALAKTTAGKDYTAAAADQTSSGSSDSTTLYWWIGGLALATTAAVVVWKIRKKKSRR